MTDEIFFQWQNQFLLPTIYPMRATKLRDFLVALQEVEVPEGMYIDIAINYDSGLR